MKTPVPPPNLAALTKELAKDPEALIRLLTNRQVLIGADEYLPWDKIRFKSPPAGLTREEWWFALKMARAANLRALPLADTEGREFSYALPDSVLRHLDDISRRASGQIAMSEQVTSPATRDRYVVSSLMEEAITSSQLEGASTTRRVAKEMIRSGRPPRDKSERMILNNYRAMRFVSDLGDRQLTPELVCEVHRIVTEGTLDDPEQAGRLQSDPAPTARVAVYGDDDQVLHRPPPVEQLPTRMASLCRFANGENDDSYIHPVLRALTVHFMMGFDHYFEDGNGRTARALFYWVMLREGYWLAEFLTISSILRKAPSKYVRSYLLTEQDGGDLTYFFLYHLNVVRRALDELDVYLARKVQELRDTRVLLDAMPGEYNYRQLALLELAMKDPSSFFTALSHATSHKVSEETARQDLIDLSGRGILERTKQGRRYVWKPAPNLPDRIKNR